MHWFLIRPSCVINRKKNSLFCVWNIQNWIICKQLLSGRSNWKNLFWKGESQSTSLCVFCCLQHKSQKELLAHFMKCLLLPGQTSLLLRMALASQQKIWSILFALATLLDKIEAMVGMKQRCVESLSLNKGSSRNLFGIEKCLVAWIIGFLLLIYYIYYRNT